MISVAKHLTVLGGKNSTCCGPCHVLHSRLTLCVFGKGVQHVNDTHQRWIWMNMLHLFTQVKNYTDLILENVKKAFSVLCIYVSTTGYVMALNTCLSNLLKRRWTCIVNTFYVLGTEKVMHKIYISYMLFHSRFLADVKWVNYNPELALCLAHFVL